MVDARPALEKIDQGDPNNFLASSRFHIFLCTGLWVGSLTASRISGKAQRCFYTTRERILVQGKA